MGVESKVTAKGQTTIPAEVREYLGLKPGDRITYAMNDGRVELRARNLRAIELLGILGSPPAGPQTIEQINEGIAEAAAESAMVGLR